MDEDDQSLNEAFNEVINGEYIPKENEQFNTEAFENYLNMEAGLPQDPDDEIQHDRVKRRDTDEGGRPISVATNNPITDTRQYEVEFLDEMTEVLTANIIKTNLLVQLDEEGHRQMFLEKYSNNGKTLNYLSFNMIGSTPQIMVRSRRREPHEAGNFVCNGKTNK